MKKKIFYIVAIILCISTLYYGLSTNEKSNNLNGIPDLHAFRKLSESERGIVLEKIDSIPINEVADFFKRKIINYVNSKELINLVSIDIYKDDLLLEENKNKKVFNNLFVDIEISINNNTMSREEAENISSEISKEIYNLFGKDTYGFLKLNTINSNFIDNKNYSNYNFVNSNTIVDQFLNRIQSNLEFKTQSIVYDFVKEHNDFTLKRFGIKNNTNELYIEIPIYDIVKEKQIDTVTNLENISKKLHHKLLSNSESKQYIEINNLTKTTISFYIPWHEKEMITYTYDF